MSIIEQRKINVLYTNWRGEQKVRTIRPLTIWFGSTKFHGEPQWLIQAEDEKGIIKDFAMRDCCFEKDLFPLTDEQKQNREDNTKMYWED